jgi:hypothetical protein
MLAELLKGSRKKGGGVIMHVKKRQLASQTKKNN